MKKLILLTIALALTPTAYAAELSENAKQYLDRGKSSVDRDKYYYSCEGDNLWPCGRHLKKGDGLNLIYPQQAIFYCDKDELILESKEDDAYGLPRYSCIYNGRTVKRGRRVTVDFNRLE